MGAKLKSKSSFFESDSFRLFMGKYGIGVILFIMLVCLSIAEPSFRSGRNLMNVAKQVAINGSIAFGMCLVITAGGIDLTVGSQLALAAVLLGEFVMKRGWGVVPACLLTLAVTTALGSVNGVLISKFNMFPFVVTLSMQLVIRGMAQVISNAQAISITDATVKVIYQGKLWGIPVPVVILLILAVIMYILLHWTKLGRYILAVGGNEKAAIASGVNVFWTKVMTYTISGFTAGCGHHPLRKDLLRPVQPRRRLRNGRHCRLRYRRYVLCRRRRHHSRYADRHNYHRHDLQRHEYDWYQLLLPEHRQRLHDHSLRSL